MDFQKRNTKKAKISLLKGNEEWLVCPCGKKLCKLKDKANANGVLLYCKKCREWVEV